MPAGMRPWQAAVPASPHLRAGTLCVRRAGKQDLCTRRASRARYALTGVGPDSGKTMIDAGWIDVNSCWIEMHGPWMGLMQRRILF